MADAAYVPILTGKQGEFDALAELRDNIRPTLRPVLDLPQLGPDKEPEKVIETLLQRVGRVFHNDGAAAVDLQALEGRLAAGVHPVVHMLDRAPWCAAELRLAVRTDAPSNYVDTVAAHHQRSRGVCVRAQVRAHVTPDGLASEVDALLRRLGLSAEEVHLCLDCGSLLSWGQTPRPAEVMAAHLERDLSAYELVSVAATSVPSGEEIKREFRPNRFQRREWAAWRSLHSRGLHAVFGDYGVTGPRPTAPSSGLPDPHLRYTTENALLIWRGWQPNRLTEEHAGEPASFGDLCRELVEHEDFVGRSFSDGDEAFDDIAAGRRKTKAGEETQGSTSQWVQWATNHHVTHVAKALEALG